MDPTFDARKLSRRGLWHYRRTHAPLAAGVAVATAVLVGALVVGDSVRGSLRGLTLERLGRIDVAIAPGAPFREALSEQVAGSAPLLSLPGSLSARKEGATRRANRVAAVGCDERFWALGQRRFVEGGSSHEGIVLTEGLASELRVRVGDEVVLRVGAANALPADSPLGEKSDTTVSRRMPVAGVLADEGLARFGLRPSQAEPRNAFVPLAVMQELLESPGECNLLVAAAPGEETPELTPGLADYGLSLEEVRAGLWQLESERLVLTEQVASACERAFGAERLQPAATYLANTMRLGEKSVPYSTVAGVGRVPVSGQRLADDEIVLNRWAADDLGAGVGDTLSLTYYEPESTHGELREAAPVSLKVAGVVDLVDGLGEPTEAADPRFTPRLEGVTDARSINDWDLPFELVEEIRQQDEDYWDDHSTTPKAFVSYGLAKRLWSTRWGDTSLVRIESDLAQEEIASRLLAEIDPQGMGFAWLPVKRQGLAAAAGSTPFDVLFLLFSMFLIASAAMLIVLLCRLAVDARGREIGLLGAVGWDQRRVRGQLLGELMRVAAIGAAAGVVLGVGYAALLLWALRTVWIDAVVTPFLTLHVSPVSPLAGALGGVLVGWLTARRVATQASKTPPRRMLAGGEPEVESKASAGRISRGIALLSLVGAGMALMAGGSLRGEAAAGAFFAAGGLLLVAGLLGVRGLLVSAREGERMSLLGLARRNIARRPGRSLLTIGLVSSASFLILATSAFRLPPTEEGTGGFQLVAESDQPIHFDLNTESGRIELGLGRRDEELLSGASVYGLRVEPGEDASCRNLYQAQQPRVLGLTERLVARGGFEWAESREGFAGNPWRALQQPAESGAIPVVIDFNTAVYALKLYGGVGSRLTIRDEAGQPVELEVVGLLKNSLLQGDLLMSEENLLRVFPSAAGYGYFLIESEGDAQVLMERLEDRLSDYGFDAQDAADRLAGFLAVQNTYLSTFQALGALGLLLGAVGLAVAQVRNLAERRGELALLRAAGFGKSRLRRMVLLENLGLLVGGLLLGAVAAGAALAPLAADARPPWGAVLLLLGATAAVGLIAGRLATARALAAPITSALRGD